MVVVDVGVFTNISWVVSRSILHSSSILPSHIRGLSSLQIFQIEIYFLHFISLSTLGFKILLSLPSQIVLLRCPFIAIVDLTLLDFNKSDFLGRHLRKRWILYLFGWYYTLQRNHRWHATWPRSFIQFCWLSWPSRMDWQMVICLLVFLTLRRLILLIIYLFSLYGVYLIFNLLRWQHPWRRSLLRGRICAIQVFRNWYAIGCILIDNWWGCLMKKGSWLDRHIFSESCMLCPLFFTNLRPVKL